ncbi:hypothetical protein O6H91_02G067400 [Diphasiastrum complanatum]|uniref:Uncharacterized protein n=2 Tax=Diphasiastrum complanatum TaxID=34168 RepID=A0ACC2EGK4_DIPCM|nr:hypothetical protein O6H91_02G049000 [Diphasiastrum complanatum]KAJ7565616.1 hypothetical protein O6H91_02G067400 [Diphasiastrum complanatum]
MARSLRKLQCITVDVTGTLLAYKGQLGDYYCMAAKSIGLPCPDYERMHKGFKVAYTNMNKRFPCFGWSAKMDSREWWRTCVKESFIQAGYEYDDPTFQKVFDRIYAAFGSTAPYILFPDVVPFLRWARSKGIVIGILSNSDSRYRDVILPALGLHQGSEWDFGVFSGTDGLEKPDPRMYELALKRAGNIPVANALHIGDSLEKDYLPAVSIGMQALLLDRFNTVEAREWKKKGTVVLQNLGAVQQWIIQHEDQYLSGLITKASSIHVQLKNQDQRAAV